MQRPPKPITTSDLLDFLQVDSSFAFEMMVRELFASRRLCYEHGGTYDDPHSGQPRQFDLLVHLNCSLPNIRTQVYLTIECKSLSEFAPMLVYRSPRTVYEAGQHLVARTSGDRKRIMRFLDCYSNTPVFGEKSGRFPLLCSLGIPASRSQYRSGDFVGKAVDIVSRDGAGKFKSGDSEVYGRWTQALQSAGSVLKGLSSECFGEQSFEFILIVPILVVPDERLYVVDFDDSGTRREDPMSTDRTSFFADYKPPAFEGDGPTFKFGHFEIMTYSGLKEYVANITGTDSRNFLDQQISEQACFEALSRF